MPLSPFAFSRDEIGELRGRVILRGGLMVSIFREGTKGQQSLGQKSPREESRRKRKERPRDLSPVYEVSYVHHREDFFCHRCASRESLTDI